MNGDFLGVGWTSPVKLDGKNQVEMARYEECVRQSIWTILSTAYGERLMRPDFGCGIHDLVFANNSAGTIGVAIASVEQSLIQWEPRIDLLDVDAYPDSSQPNRLLIQINYRVRTTNNRFNLVYPFYLE
ncbi:GPW/gp25 family protein [Aerosakkonema funiforme]|uniref:GPW/gp25 family protein n=1 Tax=Aerosakkonema funiforme FACHB-1375 TaxID=2949571 RepID=A0A926ZJ48_9CYAN|nr:GPW/gp25 family protein [Aerosakkonema funiforme]MBD2184299.1 GPW/gp25 family protein [Aerosakkonema funiforme FACHB-1375]